MVIISNSIDGKLIKANYAVSVKNLIGKAEKLTKNIRNMVF